jgi:hypothetical protein
MEPDGAHVENILFLISQAAPGGRVAMKDPAAPVHDQKNIVHRVKKGLQVDSGFIRFFCSSGWIAQICPPGCTLRSGIEKYMENFFIRVKNPSLKVIMQDRPFHVLPIPFQLRIICGGAEHEGKDNRPQTEFRTQNSESRRERP